MIFLATSIAIRTVSVVVFLASTVTCIVQNDMQGLESTHTFGGEPTATVSTAFTMSSADMLPEIGTGELIGEYMMRAIDPAGHMRNDTGRHGKIKRKLLDDRIVIVVWESENITYNITADLRMCARTALRTTVGPYTTHLGRTIWKATYRDVIADLLHERRENLGKMDFLEDAVLRNAQAGMSEAQTLLVNGDLVGFNSSLATTPIESLHQELRKVLRTWQATLVFTILNTVIGGFVGFSIAAIFDAIYDGTEDNSKNRAQTAVVGIIFALLAGLVERVVEGGMGVSQSTSGTNQGSTTELSDAGNQEVSGAVPVGTQDTTEIAPLLDNSAQPASDTGNQSVRDPLHLLTSAIAAVRARGVLARARQSPTGSTSALQEPMSLAEFIRVGYEDESPRDFYDPELSISSRRQSQASLDNQGPTGRDCS